MKGAPPVISVDNESWIQRAFEYSDRHDGRPADLVDREIEEMNRRAPQPSQKQPNLPVGKSTMNRSNTHPQ